MSLIKTLKVNDRVCLVGQVYSIDDRLVTMCNIDDTSIVNHFHKGDRVVVNKHPQWRELLGCVGKVESQLDDSCFVAFEDRPGCFIANKYLSMATQRDIDNAQATMQKQKEAKAKAEEQRVKEEAAKKMVDRDKRFAKLVEEMGPDDGIPEKILLLLARLQVK